MLYTSAQSRQIHRFPDMVFFSLSDYVIAHRNQIIYQEQIMLFDP